MAVLALNSKIICQFFVSYTKSLSAFGREPSRFLKFSASDALGSFLLTGFLLKKCVWLLFECIDSRVQIKQEGASHQFLNQPQMKILITQRLKFAYFSPPVHLEIKSNEWHIECVFYFRFCIYILSCKIMCWLLHFFSLT